MTKLTLTSRLFVLALAAAPPAVTAEVPRTAAGQPDLSGYWTSATIVPLERPAELGNREFYTEAEAEELLAESLVVEETEAGTAADVHYQLDDFGLDRSQNPIALNLRTSIITDPPNGRMPASTAETKAAADARAARARERGFDSAEDRPLAERCIVWPNEGPPMLPVGYNSNLQIAQTDDYVVVLLEMIHDARVIPVDGRAGLPAGFPQWLGSSRGRWEGDTLVVETTNFTGRTGVRGGNLLSDNARVTERFTRTGDSTILYQFTVDDPKTWTQPWSGEYPLTKIEGPMFEYACHEGNYGLANNLSGARAEERAAAKAAGKR
jgi:hypothetical protein